MKKTMLLMIICFLQISCKGQNDDKKTTTVIKNKINSTAMKTLSQDTINTYKTYEKQEYVKNDTIFKLEEHDDVYVKSTKSTDNNFVERFIYDKNTLKLKREGISFINIPIGIHKFYDENGNVIKEKNFDNGFNFTIENLISKVKSDLNIDLNNEIIGLTIGRGIKNDMANYYITIPMPPTEYSEYNRYREILINGTNGAIIHDKIITPKED